MNKKFINKDMDSILNKVCLSKLSRKETEVIRDSSMEYIKHNSYGVVRVYRNNVVFNCVPSYMKAKNRFCWCPPKSYKHR